jgi:hypothetical protein
MPLDSYTSKQVLRHDTHVNSKGKFLKETLGYYSPKYEIIQTTEIIQPDKAVFRQTNNRIKILTKENLHEIGLRLEHSPPNFL